MCERSGMLSPSSHRLGEKARVFAHVEKKSVRCVCVACVFVRVV